MTTNVRKKVQILLVANNPTSAEEMRFLATKLADIADASFTGFQVATTPTSTTPKKDHSLRKIIRKLDTAGLVPTLYKQIRFKKKLQEMRKSAQDQLKNVDLVFLSGDRSPETIEGAIIFECVKRNIPTVIAPLFVFGEFDDLMNFKRLNTSFNVSKRDFKKFPQAIHHDVSSNRFISFYPKTQLKVLRQFDYLSQNPWVMGGGKSNFVMTLSNFWKDRLIDQGVAADKVIVTGHPKYDDIFQRSSQRDAIRAQFARDYSLDPRSKWPILVLPPLKEHNILDASQHWRELNEIKQILGTLKLPVLLSLHPKMDKKEYKDWASGSSITVIEAPLHEWISVGDIFLSSFSSTTEWALGLHIPCVMLDFYGFSIRYYNGNKDIHVVQDKSLLAQTIQEALNKNDPRPAAPTPLDGKSVERIKNFILKLTHENRQSSHSL